MTTNTQIDQLIQKTRRYEFADGLRDVQFALLIGLSSVGAWLALQPFWMTIIMKASVKYGRWAAVLGMAPIVVTILVVWGMLGVMKIIRQRWLWRESGTVKPSRWVVPRGVNLISTVIFLVAIGAAAGMWMLGWVQDTFILKMIWVATGWSFGYTLAAVGMQIGLTRYLYVGLAGGLLSIIALLLPLDFGQTALLIGAIWFCILLSSGLVTLFTLISEKKEEQNE